MKNLTIFITILFHFSFTYGQSNEFKIHSNGLIYDYHTMDKLGEIVDSLNLEFKTCELSKPYYSLPQGVGYVVNINSKMQLNLIQQHPSIEDVTNSFPSNNGFTKLWIVKSEYKNYKGKKVIEFSGLPFGWGEQPQITVQNTKRNNITKGWIISKEEDKAMYFSSLEQSELPYDYARLVQYVDCMIDTASQIHNFEDEGTVYQIVNENSNASKFLKWAEKYPNEPKYPDYDNDDFEEKYSVYSKNYRLWDSLRLSELDGKIDKAHYYKSLLMSARDEALQNGNSDDNLEFYVARYLSKEDALQMKRNRRVVGGCSQDLSPRYHAMQISTLAAETAKWDIFLRAHLDVMNDRFDRVSDGSYAWASRKTYLKEIEELGIDAIDLLIGTCIRIENVDENHYLGSINRIGRALSDTQNKIEVENILLEMIKNESLDPYNRLLMAYVFTNYNANLDDVDLKNKNIQRLADAINKWPKYLSDIWNK